VLVSEEVPSRSLRSNRRARSRRPAAREEGAALTVQKKGLRRTVRGRVETAAGAGLKGRGSDRREGRELLAEGRKRCRALQKRLLEHQVGKKWVPGDSSPQEGQRKAQSGAGGEEIRTRKEEKELQIIYSMTKRKGGASSGNERKVP